MEFERLLALAGRMMCFDLALVVQMLGGDRASTRVQLSRWMKAGKVIALRRGLYTLAEDYRKTRIVPEVLATELHRPSYLSGLWALARYGLIPEKVAWFTSVTTRSPARYENAAGVFVYQHVSRGRFFAYQQDEMDGKAFFLASPEKALLDHWHLSDGEWTDQRLGEMRYQNTQLVNANRLRKCAGRMSSPRLMRAARRFLDLRTLPGELGEEL